jgi:hypothetical protein
MTHHDLKLRARRVVFTLRLVLSLFAPRCCRTVRLLACRLSALVAVHQCRLVCISLRMPGVGVRTVWRGRTARACIHLVHELEIHKQISYLD